MPGVLVAINLVDIVLKKIGRHYSFVFWYLYIYQRHDMTNFAEKNFHYLSIRVESFG